MRLWTALGHPKTAAKWGAGPAVMHREGLPACWRGGEGWGEGRFGGADSGRGSMQGPSPCPICVAWYAHLGPSAGACMHRKGGRCSGGGTASMQARARPLSPLLRLSPPDRSTAGTTQVATVPLGHSGHCRGLFCRLIRFFPNVAS